MPRVKRRSAKLFVKRSANKRPSASAKRLRVKVFSMKMVRVTTLLVTRLLVMMGRAKMVRVTTPSVKVFRVKMVRVKVMRAKKRSSEKRRDFKIKRPHKVLFKCHKPSQYGHKGNRVGHFMSK